MESSKDYGADGEERKIMSVGWVGTRERKRAALLACAAEPTLMATRECSHPERGNDSAGQTKHAAGEIRKETGKAAGRQAFRPAA